MTQPISKFGVPDWAGGGRIPGLDGLRGIAILAVISRHMGPPVEFPWPASLIPGVQLFFVISGFLITLLLLRERDKYGSISLRDFYKRRALRIVPGYLFYLLCVALLGTFGWMTLDGRYWLAALTFTTCYMSNLGSNWELTQSWSLSVTEHFYLLWPPLMARVRQALLGPILLIWLAATPFLRYGVWSLRHPALDIDFASVTQMSNIAVGCLLALVVTRRALPRLQEALIRYPEIIVIAGLVVFPLLQVLRGFGKFNILLGAPLYAIGCAAILGGVLFARNRLLRVILNSGVLVWIGQLSYSLFLWQQPFTSHGFGAKVLPHWTLCLLAIFGCAWLSYRFVELPLLQWKPRERSGAGQGLAATIPGGR